MLMVIISTSISNFIAESRSIHVNGVNVCIHICLISSCVSVYMITMSPKMITGTFQVQYLNKSVNAQC